MPEERLTRVEERQSAMIDRLARIEDALNGGASLPYANSVRGRLHAVEDRLSSSEKLQEALDAVREQQARQSGASFTRRERVIGLALALPAAVLALTSTLRLFGLL